VRAGVESRLGRPGVAACRRRLPGSAQARPGGIRYPLEIEERPTSRPHPPAQDAIAFIEATIALTKHSNFFGPRVECQLVRRS
jgi:hypothetical protein